MVSIEELYKLKAGLIDPFGREIIVPYYDIQNLCERIINEYISKSEENKKRYIAYTQIHQYYDPTFDFVVFELGYKPINPNYANIDKPSDLCPLTDDNLMIEKFVIGQTDASDSFIDTGGNILHINKNIPDLSSHSAIAYSLLNYLMIRDINACSKYILTYAKDPNNFIFADFIIKFGFIRLATINSESKDASLMYDGRLLNEIQRKICDDLVLRNIVEENLIYDIAIPLEQTIN